MTFKAALKRVFTLCVFFILCITANAQRFYNLTEDEVRMDSVIPVRGYTFPLPDNHNDSVYSVSIMYPEYIAMPASYSENYDKAGGTPLPWSPEVTSYVTYDRKKPSLLASFCPYVERDGQRLILVSFMLKVKAEPRGAAAKSVQTRADVTPAGRYHANSVLATGRWVKIRIPHTGIYAITDNVVKKAGFSNINKVKVYGYGGALINETLTPEDIIRYDDLTEVPTYGQGGKRFFHAQGPVSWSSKNENTRTRNPYSDYGYYFLTENDAEPAVADSATFVSSFYPSADDYHALYEVDNFAWYQSGRNLYDSTPIKAGETKKYIIDNNGGATTAIVSVVVTANTRTSVNIDVNGVRKGTMNISLQQYDEASSASSIYVLSQQNAHDTISITTATGGPVRLDYISVRYDKPRSAPHLSTLTVTEPQVVGAIENQNLHGEGNYDMVIIIPASKKLLSEAERLKAFHESHDGLSVRIVPADMLYNEFSSGTPDISAYRKYLKMMYDRAETEQEMPKYVLLFGDCTSDNRMATAEWSKHSTDDFLLCYESENSFSKLTSYVDDGFICLLDDYEGAKLDKADKPDVAVGRFPVSRAADAKILVDKTISYGNNKNAGAWENVLMFMGDDGDQNMHMKAANSTADIIAAIYPSFIVKKVMWDAYKRETAPDGYTYPEAAKTIKQQWQNGALIMNYSGHGNEIQMSHEKVLRISDFTNATNTNLSMWIMAGCDFMPFDGSSPNIGKAGMLNPKGGAVAFFGSTRTVRATYNERIDKAYTRHVLSKVNGKPVTIGEAQRLTKNEMITAGSDLTVNKLQYQLLGDPALTLNLPQRNIVIDSIAGMALAKGEMPQLKAGMTARVAGHVEDDELFNGIATITVRDIDENITCRLNDDSEADTAFVYRDRTKTIFKGSGYVRDSKFNMTFTVPKDISYGDSNGMINVFAVSDDKSVTAHGVNDSFTVGGTQTNRVDSLGPTIYCYLNSPSFTNGGKTNSTPFFVAEITDPDGINTTGNGIGHDMELIIDGDMAKTYILNDNFSFDFGSYTNGSTFYSIPELSIGKHSLLFRAWDVYNNSSTVELTFNVANGVQPRIMDVNCTRNPASTATTFIITHDRKGSPVDVEIEVFDTAGRLLWKHQESGVSSDSSYTVDWDLTTAGGKRLSTGVYLYRARLSCDGSSKASKAKKLIVTDF